MCTTMLANCVGSGLTPPIVSFYRKKFQLDNHNCYQPSTGGHLSQSYQSHCRRAQGTQKQNEWVYTTLWDIVGNKNTSLIQVCWFQQITNFLPFRDNKQTSSKVQMSAATSKRSETKLKMHKVDDSNTHLRKRVFTLGFEACRAAVPSVSISDVTAFLWNIHVVPLGFKFVNFNIRKIIAVSLRPAPPWVTTVCWRTKNKNFPSHLLWMHSWPAKQAKICKYSDT